MSQSHTKAFITYRRAGCTCGYTVEAVSRTDATQRLINHLLHPSAANKIADTISEHQGCTIERWDGRWSVCATHHVYIDNNAEPQTNQTELELTL